MAWKNEVFQINERQCRESARENQYWQQLPADTKNVAA